MFFFSVYRFINIYNKRKFNYNSMAKQNHCNKNSYYVASRGSSRHTNMKDPKRRQPCPIDGGVCGPLQRLLLLG